MYGSRHTRQGPCAPPPHTAMHGTCSALSTFGSSTASAPLEATWGSVAVPLQMQRCRNFISQ
jgi:hypothetical protein